MQKKAMIAMSGGVDSSVAAYLMVQDGYDCAGATLKLYDNPQCSFPGHRACCTPSDTEDAKSVAARLGMLYYVFRCTTNSVTVLSTNSQTPTFTEAHRTHVSTVTVF